MGLERGRKGLATKCFLELFTIRRIPLSYPHPGTSFSAVVRMSRIGNRALSDDLALLNKQNFVLGQTQLF